MRVRSSLLALCFLVATPVLAAPPFGNGTNILHLTLRTDLVPQAPATAEGNVSLMLRQQGHADVQKLRLEASGLVVGAPYHVFVLQRGGALPVEVPEAAFEADAHGEVTLKLMHVQNTNLDPLTDVLSIEIRDIANAVVLSADLTDPAWLQYLVKRRLDKSGVDMDAEGGLFLKQSGSKAQFRLKAANLAATSDYTVAINCTDVSTLTCDYVQPFTTDQKGRLDIKSLSGTPPAPFDMTQVFVVDAGDQVVLSTELP